MKIWVKINYSTLWKSVENVFKERKLELYLKVKEVWSNRYGLKGK